MNEVDLVKYAEMLLYTTPIVVPVLVYMCFDWRDMDKTEIAFWIILTIGFILLLEWLWLCIIEMGNYWEDWI